MFPPVGEHQGWRIERRAPGFEFTPGLLGKITTFVAIAPEGGIAIFAFMYSFLVAGGPLENEDELAEAALRVVAQALEDGAGAGSEHTYELDVSGWREVVHPAWWISVLA